MPLMIELAAFLSFVLASYLDFYIIMALLMTNATLGFIEEMNAQASVAALKDGLIRKLPVKRDGEFVLKDVAEFVPGDILFLRGGNVVPADCLFIEGDELSVDQAALTGESLPVGVPREDGDEPHSGKRLWSGSIVKQGEAHCVIIATGLNTMIGEAAKSIQESGGKHVGVFEGKIILAGRVLIILTIIAVAALLTYQCGFRGIPLDEVLEMALSLTIASVPVALPMVMKVTLSVGAKEMAKEGGIVTHLTALEEIASMLCLCSDKTGTLTTASMTVYHETAACFNGFTGKEVLTFAALASNPANKDDAIDRAVFKAYAQMEGFGTDVDSGAKKLATGWNYEKYVGFNPTVKRTVAYVASKDGTKKLRVAKGIVNKVLRPDPNDGGEQWAIENYESLAPKVAQADATFGKSGYKTLAVCVSENGGPMKYAGTLPIMDPPRHDTAETIAKIRGSMVDVKMITGDHLNIAKELARQINLGTNIYSNTNLWPASHARDELILKGDGFAQVMPKDKHEVVSVLQGKGMVVGMTGDGVNDAPALAKAQIGIAVEGATDAAQAAADIILTRPGLSPIYTAILESRRIFKRLKSYVIYRICCTVQVVAFLCIVSFGFDLIFPALYIILLALFHDLTIVTIAYDRQTPSPTPEIPTVKMLIFMAYILGLALTTSTTLLFCYGDRFGLSSQFAQTPEDGILVNEYMASVMFLQLTNSSAIIIFCARTLGFSFLSNPAPELTGSVILSQAIVNLACYYGISGMIESLNPKDMGIVWMYDLGWLLICDVIKMAVTFVQDGPRDGVHGASRNNCASFFGVAPRETIKDTLSRRGSVGSKGSRRPTLQRSGLTLQRGGSRRPSIAGPMAGVTVSVSTA